MENMSILEPIFGWFYIIELYCCNILGCD